LNSNYIKQSYNFKKATIMKCDTICFNIFAGFIFIVCFSISLFTFIIPYNESKNYHLQICNITRVEYPRVFPTTSMEGWDTCRCGGRCRSFAPYINLYASISPDKIIKNKYYFDRFDDYTFFDDTCSDGNIPSEMELNLRNAISTAENYINQTVVCYYNNDIDYIYLHKDLDYIVGIAFTCLSGIVLILWIISCIYKYKLYKMETSIYNSKLNHREPIYELDTFEA
jgi:hypothetical protein